MWAVTHCHMLRKIKVMQCGVLSLTAKPRESLEKSTSISSYDTKVTVFPCALSNEEWLSGSGFLSESGEKKVQIRSFFK